MVGIVPLAIRAEVSFIAIEGVMAKIETRQQGKKIGHGKLVAGVALHFLAPAYVLVLVADAALGHAPTTLAAWLQHALALGGPFLLLYGSAAAVVAGFAALADRRPRKAPPPADPAEASARDLAGALAAAQGLFGVEGDALLDRLARLPCDHRDSQVRDIVSDIVRLLTAANAAIAAEPDENGQLGQHTISALATLAAALARKSRQSGLLARDEALTLANYANAKYGREID